MRSWSEYEQQFVSLSRKKIIRNETIRLTFILFISLFTGLIAIALTARISYDQNLTLIQKTIYAQMNTLAEELELRVFAPGAGPNKVQSLYDLPHNIVVDLSHRLPDPITLLDASGKCNQDYRAK